LLGQTGVPYLVYLCLLTTDSCHLERLVAARVVYF
jgi:hypothetical protein